MKFKLNFKITIITTILTLVCICALLIVGLETRFNTKTEAKLPNLYLLQIDFEGKLDRIIKTIDIEKNKFETVFTDPEIITFDITQNSALIATGNSTDISQLKLLNLQNNQVQDIKSTPKNIIQIKSGGDKFVIIGDKIVENKKTYYNTFAILNNDSFEAVEVNPQLLATSVSSVYMSKSGSLLTFYGFDANHYIIDLSNPELIKKLTNNSDISFGFVNDNQLIYVKNGYIENAIINVFNLSNNSNNQTDSGSKYFSSLAITNNLKEMYITMPSESDINLNIIKRISDKKIHFEDKYSLDNLNLSHDEKYLLYEKMEKGQSLFASKKYALLSTSDFSTVNIGLDGVKAVFYK